MGNHGILQSAWGSSWIFTSCDFKSNFLDVYPGLLDRQMAPVPKYKVQLFHYKQVPMAGIGVFFQVSMRSHVFQPDYIIVLSW